MCVYDRSLLCRCGIWHLSSVWTFPTMMLPISLLCSSVCFFFLNLVTFVRPFLKSFSGAIQSSIEAVKSRARRKNGVQHAMYIEIFTLLHWQHAAAEPSSGLQQPDAALISSQMCDLCVPESEWHGKWKVKQHVCMPECLFWMLIHPHLHVLIAFWVGRLNDWLLARGDLKQDDGHSSDVCGCSTVWDMTWSKD